jgi:polysaccharide biosynthesis/export protein
VYVLGEVSQPGAYQISALGTALTALYAAGGITTRANMRQIQIHRLNKVVATLDLYDYLLRGDKRDDIRLETGDVVHVPLHGKRAQVTGAALRPAVYELKPGETLADLARAAGGFRADAALERLSIYRIVPIPERGSGPFPRAVMDVRLPLVAAPGQDPPPGAPGGEPFGPVLVPRLNVEDGDSVVVDVIPSLDKSFYVTIVGAVNKPGRFPWRDGMTLRALVVQARGPAVGAYLQEAEIARLPADRSQGQLAQTLRVPLDSTYLLGRDSAGRYLGPPGPAFAGSGTPDVVLAPFDNVLILRQPEFVLQQTVQIVGQVRFPGTYALASGKDRLADLIDRAGGLAPLAYADGIRFVRAADEVGRIDVDLTRALKQRDSHYNVVLQAGDSIVVPQYQASVKVTGAVTSPGSVLWEHGKDLSYYVNAAGGPTYRADLGRVSVRYANGQVRTRRRSVLVRGDPTPGPGSEVLVPFRDPTAKALDPVTLLGVIAQLVGAAVTLVVVAKK